MAGGSTVPGKDISPVDDISSLDKEIDVSGPTSFFINDPRHFQHLSRVPKVSMEVADGNYPTDKRIPWKIPLNVPGMVWNDGGCRDLERLLVTLTEFLGEAWSVIDTPGLLRTCLG